MAEKAFGRYEIKKELGRGGMAAVYLAYDPRFGRDVALKVLVHAFQDDPKFRSRFEREARIIATLEHPAIVPVYDFGEDNDQLYLVMRYMPGGSLAERIALRPFTIEEAFPIVQRIGEALDHAHRHGVIHRDLKPGNILFDQYHNPFLSDFGIVKVIEATTGGMTGSGVIGTPAYMSPEQVHGEMALDGRSDIYTLGIVLYEMLTGRKPFRADTPAKQMMAHLLNPIPSVLDANPTLPTTYDTIIQKALAKNRDERFTTAQELTAALTETVSGQFWLASKPPTPLPSFVVVPLPASDVVPPTEVDEATETSVQPVPDAPELHQPTIVGKATEEAQREETVVSSVAPASSPTRLRSIWLLGLVILVLVGISAVLLNWSLQTSTPTPPPLAAATSTTTATPTRTTTATATPEPTSEPTTVTPSLQPSPESLLTTVIEIGRSANDNPIEVYRFGNGRTIILLVGGLHAGYSPGSVQLAQQTITYFQEHLDEIPGDITLYVIPNLNPDSPSQPGKFDGRLNGNGVDLNRNWDCEWIEEVTWRSTPVPGAAGSEPFSEPETQSLRDFILNNRPAAVVFWEARASLGLVSPGICGDEQSNVSTLLAQIYGSAADYQISDYEEIVNQVVNGDATNWLDEQGVPAIAVLLPDYNDSDWENNLPAIQALLRAYTLESPTSPTPTSDETTS